MRETIGRYAEVTVCLLAFDCIMNKGKIKMSGIEKSIWVILIILDYHLLEVKHCKKQIVRPYVRNRSYVRFSELFSSCSCIWNEEREVVTLFLGLEPLKDYGAWRDSTRVTRHLQFTQGACDTLFTVTTTGACDAWFQFIRGVIHTWFSVNIWPIWHVVYI